MVEQLPLKQLVLGSNPSGPTKTVIMFANKNRTCYVKNMKRCCRCFQLKLLSEFGFKSKQKLTYSSYCKECNREYQKRHYLLNKGYYAEKRARYNQKNIQVNQKRIIEYLLSHYCVDCGEKDLRVLEFDHVRGSKKASISYLLNNSISWKVIASEIEKCDVRCANCHKKRTAQQFNWYKALKASDASVSAGSP